MSKQCVTHHFACDCREEKFKELERENKQLKQTVLETLNQRGQRELIVAWDRVKELERENTALRKALVNADEIERYSGLNGERQWGRCSTWLNPDDAVIIISAKALDAARKEAQP